MRNGGQIETVRNVRRLGHLDIPGGGQVVVDNRGYAYVGHMKPPYGTSIIDVRDLKNPKVVSEIRLDNDLSHTHKVRVVGDLMFTNVEQNDRHLKRKAERLDAATAKLAKTLGRAPTDAELAADLQVKDDQIAILREARSNPYRDGGWKIYDIADRTKPRLVHYERTAGFGTHRFDVDADYAYISTEMDGYVGNILVIYDLKDPAKPHEVSRWWMPGQHVAGGETPTWRGYSHRLHHAMRVGDELWAAVWQAGIRVIDVTDIRMPTTIASYNYHPPTPEPTHTILPAAKPIGGRRIAVGVDEEHEHVRGQVHAHLWIFDVSDLKDVQAARHLPCRRDRQPVEPCRPLRRAPIPGAHRRQPRLRDLVQRRPAHHRHQESGGARGGRLLHPRAGRRPCEPAEQRRRRRRWRPDLPA